MCKLVPERVRSVIEHLGIGCQDVCQALLKRPTVAMKHGTGCSVLILPAHDFSQILAR